MMREKLSETVKEFDAVLKPSGKIIYLGTPQTEMSLYNVLTTRGYDMRVWTARYPTIERAEKAYGGRLAPVLYKHLQDNLEAVYGLPTDPKRFDDEDLLEFTKVLLEKLNYKVITASDGMEGAISYKKEKGPLTKAIYFLKRSRQYIR